MTKYGKAYHAGEHLNDLMDMVNDLNSATFAFKGKASVDVFIWNDDGTVTISVDDPIGNPIYTKDFGSISEAFAQLEGMRNGIAILLGKDI